MAIQQRSNPYPIAKHVLGGLLVPPNSVARRLLSVCQDAFMDISGCLSESRQHDRLHDAYLANVERLAAVGVLVARKNGCACEKRYQAILRDTKAAHAADDKEDGCVERAWTTAKRLAGCIGRAFVARRKGARP